MVPMHEAIQRRGDPLQRWHRIVSKAGALTVPAWKLADRKAWPDDHPSQWPLRVSGPRTPKTVEPGLIAEMA